jgi:alpha-glucosidase
MLQEDDGLTVAALSGACFRTTFEVTRAADRVSIRAEVAGDGYPEFARERFRLVLHGATPATIRLAGVEVAADDGGFDLPNAGTGFLVEFSA